MIAFERTAQCRHLSHASSNEVAALHARCFDHPWSAKEFEGLLASTGIYGLGLYLGAGLIGLSLIRAILDEAEILTIGIDPAHRHQGMGAHLLKASESLVSGLGTRRFFLEVSVRNDGALRLYQSSGWQSEGLRKAYYRDGSDARVLSKLL
ncbi:ribosomal protein S18-alanine N-acetyltransferase [Woodsholea maritima]|uniref:ribosomal protein S18-alanine N-acetyltransferase n=1 Tax=Woodsholea maritima TaxID=240237 RepID=UPI000379EB02|nr:ribosomal protein S18-alanine N-acetyltransferase [Woodsholea maritima]